MAETTEKRGLQVTDADTGEVWLAERRKGLGGTDTVVLMGAGQYDDETPYFVWLKKTEGYDIPMNGAMERGHALEPVVRERYEADTGHRVLETGMWRHPVHEMILGSPDGLVVDGSAEDATVKDAIGGFEAKTTLERGTRKWPEDGSCPPRFEWQSRHYMAIMDLPWWDVACLVVDTWEIHHWRVYRDEAKERALIAACTEFWTTYVEPGIPPEVDALTATEAAYRWPVPTLPTRDLDPDTEEGWGLVALRDERKDLQAYVSSAKKRIEEIDNTFKEVAAEAEQVTVGGQTIFTWKAQSRTGIDTKTLKAERPDIVEAFSKTTTFRTLSVK